ncbi:MAG TPA: hypothetical protein VIX20_03955, partial [Ktedonobacteraceae bacterium]
LGAFLYKRLVSTLVYTIGVVIEFRNKANGLLLSPKWVSVLLERFLWQRADQRLTEVEQVGKEILVLLASLYILILSNQPMIKRIQEILASCVKLYQEF